MGAEREHAAGRDPPEETGRRAACPWCGYDVSGIKSVVCPECGGDAAAARESSAGARGSAWHCGLAGLIVSLWCTSVVLILLVRYGVIGGPAIAVALLGAMLVAGLVQWLRIRSEFAFGDFGEWLMAICCWIPLVVLFFGFVLVLLWRG